MISNKKAAENELRFIIGLIIGVGILILFVKCFFAILNIEDESVKTFNKLGGMIDSLESADEEDSTLIHLEPSKELILFFDAGVKSSIRVINSDGTVLLKDYVLFNQDNFMKEMPGTLTTVIFEKPSACGESACMVLCGSFQITNPANMNEYVSKNAAYINNPNIISKTQTESLHTVVVSCKKSKATKTFKNINHFYRLPYSFDTTDINPKVLTKFYYFKGLTLFSATDSFEDTGRVEIGKTIDKKIVEKTSEMNYLNEVNDGKVNSIKLITSNFIRFRKIDDGVVFCYNSPCPGNELDLFQNTWKNNLVGPCLESADKCAPLKSRFDALLNSQYQTINLKTETINEKKVLRVTINDKAADGTAYPEKTFYFDFDAKLRVRTKNTGKESPELTEMTFSRKGPDDVHPMISPFVALNSRTYSMSFSTYINTQDNSDYTNAKLDNIFSYKPENEQTELIFEVYEMI